MQQPHANPARQIPKNKYYTAEPQIQILIALLKAHGIRKVIASPGTTNMTFVGSIMHDEFFEIYSCNDERSAAYMACGIAAQSLEPVVLSCTGATASRNYMPGLTEAYYRKLPILALTASQHISRTAQNVPQFIDRSETPKDIATYSCTLPLIHSADDFWECELKVNNAILALTRNGGGPAHINMQQLYSTDYSVRTLPEVRKISRHTYDSALKNALPKLPKGKICVWIGNHKSFYVSGGGQRLKSPLCNALERFCAKHNAVVMTDHTSGYTGEYGVNFALAAHQRYPSFCLPDLMIYIGDVSGAYYGGAKRVWRVNPDGEFRDVFRKLSDVFEMSEEFFFKFYAQDQRAKDEQMLADDEQDFSDFMQFFGEPDFENLDSCHCEEAERAKQSKNEQVENKEIASATPCNDEKLVSEKCLDSEISQSCDSQSSISQSCYAKSCQKHIENLRAQIPELPFSNVWIAQVTAPQIPSPSFIHFGILNSLRVWNFFDLPQGVQGFCNTGGFGIDGCVSASVGASLVDKSKIVFAIVGDLAFFYDLNALGNRHIGNNLRVMLINNGKGTEFTNYSHLAAAFGSSAEDFIAAAGHYGNQSKNLVRHYAQDLGFEYFSASNKQEFLENLPRFLSALERNSRSMVFEIFTDSQNESQALKLVNNIEKPTPKHGFKAAARKLLGDKGIAVVKRILKK